MLRVFLKERLHQLENLTMKSLPAFREEFPLHIQQPLHSVGMNGGAVAVHSAGAAVTALAVLLILSISALAKLSQDSLMEDQFVVSLTQKCVSDQLHSEGHTVWTLVVSTEMRPHGCT